MVKVGLVYTSTTPELIDLVESEVKNQLPGVDMLSYQDPSILKEVRDNGFVTTQAAARLIGMYIQAIEDGVDAILNVCSSVGESADSTQEMSKYMGIPIVRIDEDMCRIAATKYQNIGVLATLPTTLTPTKNTIQRLGREAGKYPLLIDGLIDGAFNVDQKQFKKLILEKALQIKDSVDVFVFSQGSMAYCEKYIQEKLGLATLSSPRIGAVSLKKKLEFIGKVEE